MVCTTTLLLHAVIGRFLGDDHVVHVALAQARAGDSHEARLPLQLGDVPRAAVAHAGAQLPNAGPGDFAHAARYAGLKGDMCAITERSLFPIPA